MDLIAYLPALRPFLDDPQVTEVYVNPDGSVWTDRHGSGRVSAALVLPFGALRAFLNAVASRAGSLLNEDRPELAAQLPVEAPFWGARLQAYIPPLSEAPAMILRKHSRHHFSLEDLLTHGTVTPPQADRLRQALGRRENLLIAGGTSSGKTTLLDALLSELPAAERVVVIEDTRELKAGTADWLSLLTSPSHSTLQLLAAALRSHPDRIVLGELRDAAAYAFLEALSTGHPGGATTLHANSAAAALSRLARLAALAMASETGITYDAVVALVRETVDLVVVTASTPSGRRVLDLLEVAHPASFALTSLRREVEA
jgi:Flp pilus assembly CpaF family ATPase